MRWVKLLKRYGIMKTPKLRVINPRIGTSIIPLDDGDDQLFFQYLTEKIHALHFDGTEAQLRSIIHSFRDNRGITIQKMKTSIGNGREKLVLIHLKLTNDVVIRRLIKLC